MRRALGIVLAAVLAFLTACGPVPSRPSSDTWRSDARTAVDDAVAQVGTAALVVRQQEKGRLLGGYGVVTVVHAEEAIGAAIDTITAQQVPDGMDTEAAELEELLGKAETAVQDARTALVRGTPGDVRLLDRVRRELQALGDRL